MRLHLGTNTRCGVLLNIDCLECLVVTKGDLHVSCNQPPGLGRTQGSGIWANIKWLQSQD